MRKPLLLVATLASGERPSVLLYIVEEIDTRRIGHLALPTSLLTSMLLFVSINVFPEMRNVGKKLLLFTTLRSTELKRPRQSFFNTSHTRFKQIDSPLGVSWLARSLF